MNIAILGVGNMGRALVGGLKNAYGGDMRIVGWDKVPAARDCAGIEFIDPREWDFTPDVVIVAVKPADVVGVLDEFVVHIKGSFLTISIAAGISISSIREKLDVGARVCRVMPNTPALAGEGMSAYSLCGNCTDSDARFVEKIFGACGKTAFVSENLMDAVTGLSGSGPAYVYSFIEALAEGGVSAGLPYKTALDMAVQTVIGAAVMVRETGEHPSVLRSRVMSPGGTTVKGIEALERGAFKNTVMSAVAAAAARSASMAK